MLRTISSLILAAFIGIAGGLTATADMRPTASTVTLSHTALASTPMTPAQVASAKAPSASAAPKKVAITTKRIKQIRAWAGMAPCRYEDGSSQTLPCYWNAKMRGNGKGKSFIAVTPSKKGDDPRIIFIP